MRKTNTLMRCGTATFILASVAMTTPILSSAGEPVLAAVQGEVKAIINPSTTETSAPAIQKFAESSEATPAPVAKITTSSTRLAPMSLGMKLDMTEAQANAIERQRPAARQGDKNAMKQIADFMSKAKYKNHFRVEIADNGTGTVKVYEAVKPWLGGGRQIKTWPERELSSVMQRGLKDIMEKCSTFSGPAYFNADLLKGDGDLGKGQYEVECTPGTELARSQVTKVDYAYAYLDSVDLPLEQRQSQFGFRIHFASIDEYVKNNPNATFADDRAACVRMHTLHKEKHSFNDEDRAISDNFLAKCPTMNYNWRRSNNGLPEITQ